MISKAIPPLVAPSQVLIIITGEWIDMLTLNLCLTEPLTSRLLVKLSGY